MYQVYNGGNKFNPRRGSFFGSVFGIVFVILLLPTLIVSPLTYYPFFESLVITVKSKERTCYSRSNCKYLIYTEKEVFENVDDFTLAKYNSADLYNQMDPGKTCFIKVRGQRVEFLSKFRNIVEVVECK
ncbi:MAG: hypothetical protein OHK0017_01430 [Patescibacteria group bacterium]